MQISRRSFRAFPTTAASARTGATWCAGKLTFAFGDGHEETYETGDAYYAPPGHTPQLYAGSEVVEFHPTAELAKTMEVVEKNMAAIGT